MRTKFKKSLSILLCLVMLVGLLPTVALAADPGTAPQAPSNLRWENGVAKWENPNASGVVAGILLKLYNAKNERDSVSAISDQVRTSNDYNILLMPGETYYFEVLFRDSENKYSSATKSADYTVPGTYTISDILNLELNEEGKMTWTPPSYVQQYEAKLYVKNGDAWDLVPSTDRVSWIKSEHTWAAGLMKAGKTYRATLQAFQGPVEVSRLTFSNEVTVPNESSTGYTIINPPTANTNLVYKGTAQIGVPSGTGYTLSGTTSATNAGNYTATATLNTGYCWTGGSTEEKTISWSIAKKTPTAADFTFAAPSDLTYTGSPKTASVTLKSSYTGCGDITIKYARNGTENPQITNAGACNVKINVAGGQNFEAVEGLTDPSWTFTIAKADQNAPTGLTGVAPTTNGGNDGEICGLDASKKYEYKLSTESTYTDAGSNATKITGLSTGEYNVRLGGDSNHNPGTDADVSVPAYSAPTYSVTVNGGTASPSGAQAKDTVITITANDASTGMQFKEWTGADALTFVDGTSKTSATAKFKMPGTNVSVTATYEAAPLTGTATITGPEKFDQKLTASLESSNNTGTLTYKWYRSGETNPIAENTTEYTLVAEDIGKTIIVRITSDVQTGELTKTTGTIAKADGPAKPASFTIESKTSSKITVAPVAGWEYSKDNGATWQDSNVFTGLTASTTYEITVRVEETATTKASEQADKQDVKTNAGGGGSAVYVPAYSIETAKTENGSISVSSKSAFKGTTVTITATPDKGYELDTLRVTDEDGRPVKLTEKNGKYTFEMPAGKVTVKASFKKIAVDNPFVDVNTGDYFYDAVLWAVEKDVTFGTSATTFSPNDPCTRAQIVTFLWRAAGSPETKNAASFSDVSADAYYAKAVAWAVEQGITKGTSDTTFSPDATCTRAQAVTFLSRALKGKATAGSTFSDVAANSYYAEAVAWAVANDITYGTSTTTFSPDEVCTRGQIVTFLFRAMAE